MYYIRIWNQFFKSLFAYILAFRLDSVVDICVRAFISIFLFHHDLYVKLIHSIDFRRLSLIIRCLRAHQEYRRTALHANVLRATVAHTDTDITSYIQYYYSNDPYLTVGSLVRWLKRCNIHHTTIDLVIYHKNNIMVSRVNTNINTEALTGAPVDDLTLDNIPHKLIFNYDGARLLRQL
jgi:hypothetical protein